MLQNDHDHDHDLISPFASAIYPRIKNVVQSILENNPEMKPKRIRVLLNTNKENYPSTYNYEVPKLKVNQGICNRWKNKFYPASNKV